MAENHDDANTEHQPEWVQLKVSGELIELHFRIKRSSALRKLKLKFAEQVDASVESMCFLCNNHRIDDEDTPNLLGLTDGVTIEAVGRIEFTVVHATHGEIDFSMKYHAPMFKMKQLYATRVDVQVTTLVFLFNGHHIGNDDTPFSIKLGRNDVIEAVEK